MKRNQLCLAVACLLAIGGVSAQTVPVGNTAGNPQAIAIGTNSTAGPCIDQVFSSTSPCLAVGYGSTANAPGANAVGWSASAQGRDSIAIGTNPFAGQTGVHDGSVMGGNQVAIGSQAVADGLDAVTLGSSRTVGNSSTTVGNASSVTGSNSTAVGSTNTVMATYGAAFGSINTVYGDGGIAVGSANLVSGSGGIAVGQDIFVSGINAIAVGSYSGATGDAGVALGVSARANAADCVALGSNSECGEARTVSLGFTDPVTGASMQRRITNMAPGQANTDASTVGQLRGAAAAIGGGSYIDMSGNYIAPTLYLSSGNTYSDLSSAIYELDGRLWNLENAAPVEPSEPSTPAPQPTTVAGGRNIEAVTDAQGNTTVSLSDQVQLSDQGSVQVGNTSLNAQGLTIQGGPSVTSRGVDAGNRRVTSVADGEISSTSTDAINGRQVWGMQQDWDDRWEATNARLDRLDDRMNALGAKSAAMAQMAAASTPLAVGEAAVTAGAGFSSNRSALAVGYRVRVSQRTSLSAGFAIGGGSSAMGGVGVQINLGR